MMYGFSKNKRFALIWTAMTILLFIFGFLLQDSILTSIALALTPTLMHCLDYRVNALREIPTYRMEYKGPLFIFADLMIMTSLSFFCGYGLSHGQVKYGTITAIVYAVISLCISYLEKEKRKKEAEKY